MGMKNSTQKLSPDLEWLFPEYVFEQMGLESHQNIIIERILEKGSWEQVRWLFNVYGKDAVTQWVRKHGFRLLSKRSFALWKLTLDIRDFEAPEWARLAKAEDPW
jgi:hypothetical protein